MVMMLFLFVQMAVGATMQVVPDTLTAAAKQDSLSRIHGECIPSVTDVALLSTSFALVTVGAIGISNGWMCDIKEDVQEGLQDWRDGRSRWRCDDYLQYLPLAVNLGLGLTGIKARHGFRERLAVSATATALHVGLTQGIKLFVDEQRPNGRNAHSFPSGHTSWAFMGAEMVREEYGLAWGLGAYTLATSVAFMRLYNNEHWLNDVIAGAGIGILSARVAYLLLPFEQRLFRWDSNRVTTVCVPVYTPADRGLSLAMHLNF